MVEPISLIFRVFTTKISGVPKFRNFAVIYGQYHLHICGDIAGAACTKLSQLKRETVKACRTCLIYRAHIMRQNSQILIDVSLYRLISVINYGDI